jgi:hypothetical protein
MTSEVREIRKCISNHLHNIFYLCEDLAGLWSVRKVDISVQPCSLKIRQVSMNQSLESRVVGAKRITLGYSHQTAHLHHFLFNSTPIFQSSFFMPRHVFAFCLLTRKSILITHVVLLSFRIEQSLY